MSIEQITEDAKAILLLCGHFGLSDDTGVKPLNIRDYDEVAAWLITRNWWPADLLNDENLAAFNDALVPVAPERLMLLLTRGASMAMAIEKWVNKGLWVLCRSDEDYPQRLKRQLRRLAPPILYGAGDRSLLSRGGLAVVGSRQVNEETETFARAVGKSAAASGMQLISGAARGVDETAMHGAFEEGGTVVGVMANGLLRAAVSGKYREGIRNGRLALISPYNPEAPFNSGNAMGRNKYIYALADYAIVVNSGYQEGGTWAGAKEALRRQGGNPVFVRAGPEAPRGNMELVKLGGRPFPENALNANLREFLEQNMTGKTTPPADFEAIVAESSADETVVKPQPNAKPGVGEPAVEKVPVSEAEAHQSGSVYETVKPLIVKALGQPKKVDELAKEMNLRKSQVLDWVKQLVSEGILEERMIGKVKKFVIRKPEKQLNLF